MNLEILQQQGWHIYDEVIFKRSQGTSGLHSIGIKIHKNENAMVELVEYFADKDEYAGHEFNTFEDAVEYAEKKLNNE